MKEVFDIRIFEEQAHLLSNPDAGRLPGLGLFRRILVSRKDSLFAEIEANHRRLAARGKVFFASWGVKRSYSHAELEAAELFRLSVKSVFEPSGEECGTTYDETGSCSRCGGGIRQASPLYLDMRKVPRKRISATYADEIVLSDELANLLGDSGITGVCFGDVHHRALYEDDPVDYRKTGSGRELLEKARCEGLEVGSARYYIWLNKPEQKNLVKAARAENVDRLRARERSHRGKFPTSRQLMVVPPPVEILTPPTEVGENPFEVDFDGQGRCACRLNLGHTILSELHISRSSWDGSDFVLTRQVTGSRRGFLRPHPRLLVSKRTRDLLVREKVPSLSFEVVHLH